MDFEEVLRYVRGTVGHRIDVHAWPNRVGEIGVHLSGVVERVVELPVPGKKSRYFCQIGGEEMNGFHLSPVAFESAGVDLADPDTLGLFVELHGDYRLVIEDQRIGWQDGKPAPLPG